MADIKLTSGDDTYNQTIEQAKNYSTVYGLEGQDKFKAYNGNFMGGAGNDTFEQVNDPQYPWMSMQVVYWDSPKGVLIDLQAGYANDGYGFKDILIGIDRAGGSGRDDVMIGNANDNFFSGNGGNDTIQGGSGNDGVGLNWFQPAAGQPWRQTLLSDITVTVSVDGRKATIKPTTGSGFSYDLTDCEYFSAPVIEGGPYQNFSLSDFISPVQQAQQAIAAGTSFRWNSSAALGSAVKLTYSFVTTAPSSGPGATGFHAFSLSEQNLVNDILTKTAQICGLEFTRVDEKNGATGQLRFGISEQTQSKGISWMPGQANAGDLAGDVWMDIESMRDIHTGSEGYEALIHEIGHALGLRHPTNTDSGDSWVTQLRSQDDVTALTVMSGGSSSDGLFRSDWGPLDILALRYLYGSKSFNSTNTTYTLGEAQAKAQTSIVDDGGDDTLDASALTYGAYLNLNPGKLSSVGLTSTGQNSENNLAIAAGTWIENVNGTAYDDVLIGNDLNNRMAGVRGNDMMNGGKGFDTAVFSGTTDKYKLTFEFENMYVAAKDGISGFDALTSIEALEFTDKTVWVETKSHSSYSDLPTELYQFFITAFNAAPGVTYMDQLAEAYRYGMSVKQIVDVFTTKKQFTDVYSPSLSHSNLATQLVNNIVKNSATANAKTEAIADIKGALDLGWTVGDVIYTVFGNLAHKALTDVNWGNTAKQFSNEITVAKYYTEVLNQSTTDLETLRDAIQPVTQATDVSSDTVVAQLIGVALMTGGLGL